MAEYQGARHHEEQLVDTVHVGGLLDGCSQEHGPVSYPPGYPAVPADAHRTQDAEAVGLHLARDPDQHRQRVQEHVLVNEYDHVVSGQ